MSQDDFEINYSQLRNRHNTQHENKLNDEYKNNPQETKYENIILSILLFILLTPFFRLVFEALI